MKKAERIYRDTKYECRKHVEDWGYNPETDGGFTGLIYKDSELVSTRTFNAIDVLLKRDERLLADCIELNIGTPDANEFKGKVLTMVRRTLRNSIRSHERFELALKEEIAI